MHFFVINSAGPFCCCCCCMTDCTRIPPTWTYAHNVRLAHIPCPFTMTIACPMQPIPQPTTSPISRRTWQTFTPSWALRSRNKQNARKKGNPDCRNPPKKFKYRGIRRNETRFLLLATAGMTSRTFLTRVAFPHQTKTKGDRSDRDVTDMACRG